MRDNTKNIGQVTCDNEGVKDEINAALKAINNVEKTARAKSQFTDAAVVWLYLAEVEVGCRARCKTVSMLRGSSLTLNNFRDFFSLLLNFY